MESHILPHRMYQKRLTLFAFLSFVVFLITGILYWYIVIYRSPDNILLRAFSNIKHIETFEYFGTLKLSYGSSDFAETVYQAPLEFSSGFVGSFVKNQNDGNPRVSFSGTLNAGETPVSEFDAKVIDKTLFIFIKHLADIGFIDNQKILNQWVSIEGNAFPPTLDQLITVPFWQIDNTQISTVIIEGFPFHIIEVFPEEQVEGILSYHYRYQVDNRLLRSLSNQNAFDLSEIEFGEGEVWISKEKNQITAATFTIHKNPIEKDAPDVSVSGNVSFRNTNSPIAIESPSTFVTLQEILQSAVKGVTIPE